MGNEQSSSEKKSRRSKKSKDADTGTTSVKSTFGDISATLQSGMKKIEESSILETVCGLLDDDKLRSGRSNSYAYSEDFSEDSRTISDDSITLDEYDRRRKGGKKDGRSESESLLSDSQSDASKKKSKRGRASEDSASSFISEDSSLSQKKGLGKGVVTETTPDTGLSKPLASSFAKRCYFTKAGIGKTTQHYEGLTLTGNIVLMLASAMKLKGCPTICDEDLRRVEQTYPNQFSRLPDELLLSSGWRRISKYCHFSNKPIPDGVPFFHSKQRIHPSGGYYFLLAAAVGMIRPIEVEPLTRDTLVLLETDYPTQCDAAPNALVEDPTQWTLVDKFCFFSGGPVNTEEDVYYQADFDGNLIFMLAFLSPSLTPVELYKLGPAYKDEPGLKSMAAVEEVEAVYDLTERDFDDLKLYHLGPCRALPPYILQPTAWTKVLPPHFLAAKEQALRKAHDYEHTHGVVSPQTAEGATIESDMAAIGTVLPAQLKHGDTQSFNFEGQNGMGAPPEHYGNAHYSPGYAPSCADSFVPSGAPVSYHAPPGGPGSYAPSGPGSYAPSGPGSYAPSGGHGSYSPSGGHGSYSPSGGHGSYGPSGAVSAYQDPKVPPTHGAGSYPASVAELSYQDPSIGDPSYPDPSIGDYFPHGREPDSLNHPYSTAHHYPSDQHGQRGYAYGPSPRSEASYEEENFQREVEEEGAFIDSSAPIDEAIASWHRKRTAVPPMHASIGPMSSPGYIARSEAGSSQMIDPLASAPPNPSKWEDVPDDEGGSYIESAPQSDYSNEQYPYHANGGEMRNHATSPTGYYQDEEYYQSQRPSGDSSDYYEREEEYYESPEKGNQRVHTALEQQRGFGTPAVRSTQPSSQFIYSPDESELMEAYRREDASHTPSEDRYYEEDLHQNDDPTFSATEGDSYQSPEYDERGQLPPEEARDFVPTEQPSPPNAFSPRSDYSYNDNTSISEYSQTSAMRGAQELLKKNRQKRLEMAMRKHREGPQVEDEIMGSPTRHKEEEEEMSGATSMVSGSSVWTDASQGDRTSRRALILQMAKSRMKSNKMAATPEDKVDTPIVEEDPNETKSMETKSVETKSLNLSLDLAVDLD